MMTRTIQVALFAIGTCISAAWLSSAAIANAPTCTHEEALAAEGIAATARSWRQLHRQFTLYSHCDDGAIAEGFSESVTHLLAEHWRDIRQLDSILKSAPTFRSFVLRHIDETTPPERLSTIATNANKRCPRSLKTLCNEIEMAAKKATQ